MTCSNNCEDRYVRTDLALLIGLVCKCYCVTLDPKIKETTQTTNQIKCEWALINPPTQCDLTNSHTLKQVAVGYYKESWGKQDLL